MPRDDTSLRDAGAQIANSGLTDDVVNARGRDLSQRQDRREALDRDADAKPRRAKQRQPAEDDDHDYGDGDTFGGEDDAEAGSYRDSEETDNDGEEPDEGDDDASQSEDDDREPEEGEDDQPAEEAKHKVKVHGKEFEVTTSELIRGYQRNKDYQIKTHALAKNAREMIAGHSKKAEEYASNLVTVGRITNGLKTLIVGDLDSQQMRQLRATDPQAWYEQRALMTEKVEKLDAIIAGLSTEAKRHLDGVSERQKADLRTLAQAETDKLVEVIPNWFTPDKPGGKSGSRKVVEFLTQAGFSQEEVLNVYDSRMLIVADYARRYVELMTRQNQGQRQNRAPKKLVKPGQTHIRKGGTGNGGGGGGRQNDFKRAAAHAKKTGTTRDAGQAISRLLK